MRFSSAHRWVLLALLVGASLADGRQTVDLNLGWRYHRGPARGDAQAATFGDSGWERVALPHTYALASINMDDSTDDQTQPTFHRDICWYRRPLSLNAPGGSRVFLEFEGAHQVTDLWVNGRHVGQHAVGGFTPFHFDITDFVDPTGDNAIALRLDNRVNENVPPDGDTRDYVLFGGLYRDVRLVVTDPLHVTFPWEAREAGVRVTTPSVSRRAATITVETAVRNDSDTAQKCRVVTMIADAEGTVVERLATDATILAGMSQTVVHTGGIDEDVRLWSCDDPYLYRVHTLIERDGDTIDHVVNPLGLRWFQLDQERGFLLNDRPIELIGANRHQQYPYVGDAVPNNLHRADAILFKQAGVNVIRLAHYPHDDAFLEACNELGILVAEEAPTWIESGPPLWRDRLEQSLRVMIRNHRNHPCVWGWGGGINHRGPVKRLQYAAKEEDPTRVTISNSTLWTGTTHAGVTDLYGVMDYRGARVPPNGLLFCIEHSGSIDAIAHQRIVSLYRSDPRRIGLALWSAHDGPSFKKRGETNPNHSVWKASLWDAFRSPKPPSHWYRSELTAEPMVHVPDDRAQKPGTVTVFSNCDRVALRAGGTESPPVEPARTDETRHLLAPPFVFPFDWRTGELTAIGYINGVEVAAHTVRKPAEPHHLELRFATDGFDGSADGSSIVLAYATVCDASGTTVPDSTPPVTFSVTGPAEIVGDASIGANPIVGERGVAPVLVRVGIEPGDVTLRAAAAGLVSATATLALAEPADDPLGPKLPRVPLRLRVDLGNPEQHVEEGWTAWSAGSGPATLHATALDGTPIEATLGSEGPDVNWTNTWGVPGDRSFLIEDGAESPRGLRLTFGGLPTGEYTLRTWHHRVADSRDDAPPIDITVRDAAGERQAHRGFEPTFGRRIQVSDAGNGGAGDGGSDLAYGHPAVVAFEANGTDTVTIEYATRLGSGPLNLNGFDLRHE